MSNDLFWQPGKSLTLQHVWNGRVFSAIPMTVVHDTSESTVLWSPRGTHRQNASTPARRARVDETRLEALLDCLQNGDWDYVLEEVPNSSLWFVEPGRGYAYAFFRLPNDEPLGWYVNLQEPVVRKHQALETMDLALDIIVNLDLTWRWKDEDEFEALIEQGLISPEKAAWVRQQGLDAITRVEARAGPFSEPWPDWRPDPSWQIPVLPEDWQRV